MHKFSILLFLCLLFSGDAAGQRSPGRRGAAGPAPEVPTDLDLPKAEQLLLERNLSIIANQFQLDAVEQARLIAGYKPNPFLQFGLEQVPFRSPIAGSFPRSVTTNPDAGANPVTTGQFNKIFERGVKRRFRIEQRIRT